MPELEDRLREVLQRRAAGVPPRLQPPPRMLRRARRRVALTAATGALSIALVAGGAVAGIRLAVAPRNATPLTSASPGPQVTPSPAQPTVRTCTAADLTGRIDLSGSGGQAVGSIIITNGGSTSCTLTGVPRVSVFDDTGRQLAPLPQTTGQAWWQVDGASRPGGWPFVTLRSGQRARVRIQWSNWCPTPPAQLPSEWRVELPGEGGTVSATDSKSHQAGCIHPSQPNRLQVGPFEPDRP